MSTNRYTMLNRIASYHKKNGINRADASTITVAVVSDMETRSLWTVFYGLKSPQVIPKRKRNLMVRDVNKLLLDVPVRGEDGARSDTVYKNAVFAPMFG